MIIGNNNSNNNILKENNKAIINPTIENERVIQHTDVNSKSEMISKAYSVLQERHQQGLISLDEFTKKCNALRKKM